MVNKIKMIFQIPSYQCPRFFWIIIVLIVVGAFIIQIAIGVYVYKDAKNRNMDPTMWLLIVLLIGIIALIIYLIVREPKSNNTRSQLTTYSQSALSIEKGVTTPSKNKKPVESNYKYCSNCGKELTLKSLFCSHCGKKA